MGLKSSTNTIATQIEILHAEKKLLDDMVENIRVELHTYEDELPTLPLTSLFIPGQPSDIMNQYEMGKVIEALKQHLLELEYARAKVILSMEALCGQLEAHPVTPDLVSSISSVNDKKGTRGHLNCLFRIYQDNYVPVPPSELTPGIHIFNKKAIYSHHGICILDDMGLYTIGYNGDIGVGAAWLGKKIKAMFRPHPVNHPADILKATPPMSVAGAAHTSSSPPSDRPPTPSPTPSASRSSSLASLPPSTPPPRSLASSLTHNELPSSTILNKEITNVDPLYHTIEPSSHTTNNINNIAEATESVEAEHYRVSLLSSNRRLLETGNGDNTYTYSPFINNYETRAFDKAHHFMKRRKRLPPSAIDPHKIQNTNTQTTTMITNVPYPLTTPTILYNPQQHQYNLSQALQFNQQMQHLNKSYKLPLSLVHPLEHQKIFYGGDSAGFVMMTSIDEFSKGRTIPIYRAYYKYCAPPVVTQARAKRVMLKGGFGWFNSNCEHLATWCMTGIGRSLQIEDILVARWKKITEVIERHAPDQSDHHKNRIIRKLIHIPLPLLNKISQFSAGQIEKLSKPAQYI